MEWQTTTGFIIIILVPAKNQVAGAHLTKTGQKAWSAKAGSTAVGRPATRPTPVVPANNTTAGFNRICRASSGAVS